MSSPEESWWSVRAGEYVLGTLRDEDLRLFEQILAHDTAMQVEVARWEQRLSGLDETTLQREPAEHVWPGILERVRQDEKQAPPQSSPSEPRQISETSVKSESVIPITSSPRTRLWQTIAGLATAASLVLGFLLVQQIAQPGAPSLTVDGLAVVLSDDEGKPYFLVETDYGNLRVRVTALSPPSLDDSRDFQLWQALPDRSSVRPVALLPEEPGTSRVFSVNSLIDGSDLFGVSIEPVGAETSEGPTGPVVAHGDFLPSRSID